MTLFLVNSLCMGGSEKKIVAIANALAQRGKEVHIAYLNRPDTLRSWVDPNVPVIFLNRTGKFSFKAVARLHGYLQKNNIRRIVSVNLHPLLYAFLASRMSRPARACIALVNTSTLRSQRDKHFMRLYAPLLRKADQVIFGSKSQEKVWVATYRLNQSCCTTIFNGVDTEFYDSVTDEQIVPASEGITDRIGEGRYVVGSVGALRPEKAYGDLIRAAGELQRRGVPVTVLLVGSGPCESHLRQVADQESITDSVIFYGQVRDVRPLLSLMDVYVSTSVAVETFSNAALEAMSSKCSVVLSDVGGAREMVVHEKSGFIYSPGDINQLSFFLQELYRNPVMRVCMAAAARARVTELFSFDNMLREYQRIVISDNHSVSDQRDLAG